MAEWAVVACQNCHVEFAIRPSHDASLRKHGDDFYCPNGHTLTYGEGEADKLRRERDRLKQRLAQKDDTIQHLEGSIAAHKGQITKLKNRASKGVCPCCNRTFQNLARHMKTKHPDYATIREAG